MPSTIPEPIPGLGRALELARSAVVQNPSTGPSAATPWTAEQQLLVARVLLAAARGAEGAAERARARALEEAAEILDALADREVLQPALVATYVRIAGDIRALAAQHKDASS